MQVTEALPEKLQLAKIFIDRWKVHKKQTVVSITPLFWLKSVFNSEYFSPTELLYAD